MVKNSRWGVAKAYMRLCPCPWRDAEYLKELWHLWGTQAPLAGAEEVTFCLPLL